MVQQFPDAKTETERPETTTDEKSQPAATSLKLKETAMKISEEGNKN